MNKKQIARDAALEFWLNLKGLYKTCWLPLTLIACLHIVTTLFFKVSMSKLTLVILLLQPLFFCIVFYVGVAIWHLCTRSKR